jgi:hypothetical protein
LGDCIDERQDVVTQQFQPGMERLDDRVAPLVAIAKRKDVEIGAPKAGKLRRGPEEHVSIVRQDTPERAS